MPFLRVWYIHTWSLLGGYVGGLRACRFRLIGRPTRIVIHFLFGRKEWVSRPINRSYTMQNTTALPTNSVHRSKHLVTSKLSPRPSEEDLFLAAELLFEDLVRDIIGENSDTCFSWTLIRNSLYLEIVTETHVKFSLTVYWSNPNRRFEVITFLISGLFYNTLLYLKSVGSVQILLIEWIIPSKSLITQKANLARHLKRFVITECTGDRWYVFFWFFRKQINSNKAGEYSLVLKKVLRIEGNRWKQFMIAY